MSRVYLEYQGDSVELPLGETVIGRDVGCALRFNDPAVSRRHVRFVRREGEVFVEDLKSSNGTLLNGRTVSAPIHVRNGDILRVGSRELVVRMPVEDAEEPSTLVLRDLAALGEVRPARAAVTSKIAAIVLPPLPANQRCPRCGAAVSSEDEECETCKYRWGSFRPQARTDVRDNPLSRRRHERRSVELAIVYASSELEIEAISRDLSQSGVFVCSEVLDPVGTTCELTVLLDGGPPLHIKGVVRRVVERQDHPDAEPVGLGIEFVEVGATERAWLEATVEKMIETELGATPE